MYNNFKTDEIVQMIIKDVVCLGMLAETVKLIAESFACLIASTVGQ